MKKPALVILAAGLAQRYGSLKQIEKIGPSGETLIDYSIYDAVKAGINKVVFIIRNNIEEEFREVFVEKFSDRIKIDYVFQELNHIPKGIKYSKDRNVALEKISGLIDSGYYPEHLWGENLKGKLMHDKGIITK